MSFDKALSLFRKGKKFLISTHVNPDPDALCCELALYFYLRSKGKIVTIVNNEEVPKRLAFLTGTKQITPYKDRLKVDYDVAIVVDCGSLDRIGRVMTLLDENKALINIDHHITNNNFGAVNIVLPKASSTAEILFEFLAEAKCKMTNTIAMHLYAGIMTDTGSFRYENTTSRTHEITAVLKKYSFSSTNLYQQLYEMIPHSDMKYFTAVVSSFDVLYSGKVLTVSLHKNVLNKFSDDFDLRDAVFKYLRAIKGVEVVVIFTQVASKKTRVNFRSSGRVNVAALAHYFKGGGHHNASGCMLEKDLSNTKKDIVNKLRKLL